MLNRAQHEAVRTPGHALITACPGSGKTTVLKFRAAHILETVPNSIVCGVTFTAQSAKELDSRIRTTVPGAGDRVICGTFHSLCKQQLIKAGVRFVLVNAVQQGELTRRAYFETLSDTRADYDDVVQYIDRMKAMVDPFLPSQRSEPMIAAYHRYQELLGQMGAMDFSDLLVAAVRGMCSGDVRPVQGPSGEVTHMLVDEFQDTDPVQLAWVKEHVRRGAKVTVVGDDDQSIYGWRNALGYVGMMRFRDYTDAAHIALNVTYRCAREIIVPAARLITHNEDRVEKVLETANREQGHVSVKRFKTDQDEIDGVLKAVIMSGSAGDWGILARTNAQLDAVERVLVAETIDYVRSGGTSFWDMKAPSLFLGVCQSLAVGDMIGVDELLRKVGAGEGQIARIHQECNSRAAGALDRFTSTSTATSAREDAVGVLRKRVADWRKMLQQGEAKLAMQGLALYIKKHAKLYEKDRGPDIAARDHRALDQCVQTMSRLSGNMRSRLVALRAAERNGDKTRSDCVRLMTLHSSKGLEFDRVWMMGCQQGTLPSRESPIDEERRLFFVGMTRAKRDLTISYVISELNPKSMFIRETGIA